MTESRIAQITNFGRGSLTVDEAEGIVAEVWNAQFGPFTDEDIQGRRPAFAFIAKAIAAQ